MSASTHVIGFMPPDDRWRRMKAVWDACAAANIDPPAEVDEFFGGEAPDDTGREVEIPHRRWQADMSEGVEVDVAALPDGVTVIRFYNSY